MKISKAIKVLISLPPSIIILIVATFLLWKFRFNPYHNSVDDYQESLPLEYNLSTKQACKDIKYFYNSIKQKHPVWLDGSTEKQKLFDATYKSIISKYKNSEKDITVLEIWKDCSRMIALLKDSHTNVRWYKPYSYIEDFSQINKYGYPEKINDIPFEKVLEDFYNLYGWESKDYAKLLFIKKLYFSKEYLQLLGFDTSSGINFTFNTENGPVDFHYNFREYDENYDSNLPVSNKSLDHFDEIAFLNQLEDDNRILIYGKTDNWIWYFTDKKNDIAVLFLKQCNYNEEYINTVNQFFDTALSLGISRVAVDLRGNSGGNSRVATNFITHLNVDSYKNLKGAVRYGIFLFKGKGVPRINNKTEKTFNGEVYVITDIATFSSAMDFAMIIQDNNIGKIIGQASGNLPDGYGDIIDLQLPESKLAFTCSFKKWYRIDSSKTGKFVEPDIPLEENPVEKFYKNHK